MFCAAIILLSSRVAAEPAAISDAPSRVETCANGRYVCATLITVPVSKTLERMGYRWGGEDLEPPKTLVSHLTAAIRGQDVFIPLSAFADLGNPHTVEVKMTKLGFDILISGGDASASYHARLAFDKSALVRRRVQHGEFKNEAWEETRYKFNQMRN